MPTVDSVCPLDCPDTCSLDVTVEAGAITAVDGSRRNPFTAGFICAKVRRYAEQVYSPLRLRYPQRRVGAKGDVRYERIGWDDAIGIIAERFRQIDGEAVRVFNDLGEVHVPVRLTRDLRPGIVTLPKGLWRSSTLNGSTATALVSDALTDIGGGACFNDARVDVAPL